MDYKKLSKKIWNIILDDITNKVPQNITHNKIDILLRDNCSPKIYNNINYRKDKRNFPQFFLDIKKGTDNELKTLIKWKEDLKERGTTLKAINNGIDNTGLPVIYDTKLGKPDFSISLNSSKPFLVDIKNNLSTNSFMTFKVDDLKRYYEKRSFIYVNMNEYWILFGPNFIKGLLEDWPREIFPRFAPNKEAIRVIKDKFLYLRDCDKLCCYNWNDKKKFKLIDKKTNFKNLKKDENMF